MRTAWRCLMMGVLLAAAGTLAAPASPDESASAGGQDRAVPRDKAKQNPPAEAAPPAGSHPSPEAAPQAPSRSPRNDAGTGSSGATSNTKRRRPRPDGQSSSKPPAARPDARDRHPRPEPHDAYRDQRYDWRHWQFDWWYPDGHFYLFPYRYPNAGWHLWYRGFRVTPHARLPYHDGWFYWPYEDAYSGCGWYWVPTRRERVHLDEFGWVYRYWRYRRIYVCFD